MSETTELQAAVERYRMSDYRFLEVIYRDRCTIADAYLSEHPADENEPVTPEWLESVGWERLSQNPGVWSKLFYDVYNHKYKLYWFYGFIQIHDVISFQIRTRGDVRRLCAAMGITLNESEEQ